MVTKAARQVQNALSNEALIAAIEAPFTPLSVSVYRGLAAMNVARAVRRFIKPA